LRTETDSINATQEKNELEDAKIDRTHQRCETKKEVDDANADSNHQRQTHRTPAWVSRS
jgi:hypothetical protein